VFPKGLRRPREKGEGAIVHGDDHFGLQELASLGRLSRPHDVMIPYREHGDFRLIKLADEAQVVEEARISSVVKSAPVFEFDHKTCSVPPVNYVII